MARGTEEFRRVVEMHQGMVFSMALRVVGDRGLAEEVAQDVFLEFYRGAEAVESEEHVRFWLRRVAVHRATDALRRRARRPESGAEEWSEEMSAACEQTLASLMMGARLEELLRTLPQAQRVAVMLRYQEDLPPEEIAAVTEQPVATVKSHLQRGLQLLRRKAAVTLKEYVR